jgi:dUTP pyrophosphatase
MKPNQSVSGDFDISYTEYDEPIIEFNFPAVPIKVKKLHKDAAIPFKSHESDVGYDVTAVSIEVVDDLIKLDTGLAFEIPPQYALYLFPRSSVSKTALGLANSVGVIDPSYRGPVKAVFRVNYNEEGRYMTYNVGDKIGQLVVLPRLDINWIESDELDDTERGSGGFGSTGK